MDIFSSIARWAGSAWDGLSSLTGDVGSATQALWSYASSVYQGLAWWAKVVISPGYYLINAELNAAVDFIRDVRDALDRVAWWVDNYMISPVEQKLIIRIIVLQAWTMVQFELLTKLVYVLHIVEERHTDVMVGQEREARIKDIASARAYSRALTTQLHQGIEAEAAAGYKAGQGIRTSLLTELAQDLHVRGLLDTAATEVLIKAVDALVAIDNPVIAAAANRVISTLIKKSGIGADIGDLIDRLINPGAGGNVPKDLHGVIADLTHRIAQLEDWVSKFMLNGGPEVEDAGRQWKTLNSLVVDAALLAFFGQAVAAPEAWATEVSDTVGVLANETVGRIIGLIGHA